MDNKIKIQLYTDGAAANNGQAGSIAGWGWVAVINGVELNRGSGKIENGTNNQGELQAIIEGLRFLTKHYNPQNLDVEVYSDSSYCIKGITEWVINWKKNGWRTSTKTPVKNIDYWKNLDVLTTVFDPQYYWVRGHSGNEWNEVADKIAYGAAREV